MRRARARRSQSDGDAGHRSAHHLVRHRGPQFHEEDLERNVSKGGEFFDEHYGKGTTWYLYGGHRVWKSPEDLETYTPDNVPVEAEERPSGGRFVCRAAKWLDYALDIELADDGTLTVKNTVENTQGRHAGASPQRPDRRPQPRV